MQGINNMRMAGIQSGQMRISPMGDAVTKRLQSEIEEVQRQIQNLASNENMTTEQKQKKKQELEDKIMDLQAQLQQHLSEQRQEEKEEQTKAAEQKTYDETGMQTVISSDAAIKHAKTQEATANRMEGRAAVLRSEMELDIGRQREPVKSKENELSKAEQGAENARFTQMQILGKTNQKLDDDKKKEQDPEYMEEEKAAKEKKEEILGYTSDGKPVTKEEESQVTARA